MGDTLGSATRCAFRFLLFAIALVSAGCSDPSEVSRQVAWSIVGEWLIADTHSHTTFTDGALSVPELVERAIAGGCDVLAITDHSDLSEDAATPEYFEAMRAARVRTPWLILFGGLEWNIPPYGGREHVNLLIDPAQEEQVLTEFKHSFEANGDSAALGLEWLANKVAKPEDAVLIYNHPSRKDRQQAENVADMLAWRQPSGQFVAFEGGPGHQKAKHPGDYRGRFKTVDRWDPVVASIGGTWDDLLDRGQDVWGAVAVSDYHNDRLDESPCAFARTHVQVPERSANGVLQALAAGSFWADHGRILDELSFMLWVSDLELPVFPGETVKVTAGEIVTASLLLAPGPGLEGEALTVELIGNGRSGKPELLDRQELASGETNVQWEFAELMPGADDASAFFRVRVRASSGEGKDRLAVSNSIRAIVR